MKQVLTLAALMVAALVSPTQAKEKRNAAFPKGTPVVVVGPITSPPKGELNEQKMQVGIGPERADYTLHFRDARLLGLHGEKIDEDGFDSRQWVRAEGTVMGNPRRIKVSRVQVISSDEAGFPGTPFARPGFAHGYVLSVAGSRATYPESTVAFGERELVLVGKVSDDTGAAQSTRKVQVLSAGNEWTLNVPDEATVLDQKGGKLSVHEVRKGQWVRATGFQTDDLRMRVTRLENVGVEDVYRTSSFFRSEWPLGYTEYQASRGSASRTEPVEGTVMAIDATGGYLTVRDAAGKEHRVYTGAEIAGKFKVGDRVRVHHGDPGRATAEPLTK